MILKFKKLDKEAKIGSYAYKGDAGLDLFSNQEVILKPFERKTISTGIALEIPKGYVGLIWDKSGIASKIGLKTMGGVIDSNYRGEIKIVVFNTSKEEVKIEKGQKIAQMLIQKVEQAKILEVEELSETERNEKGFGSSGIK